MRALLFTGLLCCSLFIGGIGGLGIAAGTQRAEAQQPASSGTGGGNGIGDLETESFEADRTVFIITVRENGSATWRFRYEQRLEADADIENFESYADRFNANETDSFRNFRERAVALADSGSNVTGREMSADRFRRDARIEERPPAGDEFGVIEMSFVWSGFATIDGGDVVAGDVFVGGLYVGPDQQLRVERGPNLRFESTAPEPDTTAAGTLSESETITWIGETSFADRQPRVVFVERDAEGASTGTDSEATSTTPPDQPTDDATGSTGPVVPLVAIGIVIVLGMSAAFVYRAGLFATGTIETDESPSNRMSDDGGTEAGTTTPASDAGAGETADGSERPDEGTSHPIAEGEFLSDEERVVALLESQGGRMKQVDIVDQTDWSKSKVSMLLSDMESEGTVSKLRVGRENIVSLAGHEPDAAGSPFDNE
jgi:hypothetical protein